MAGNALNPLPSLLRASAFDAANMQMRAEGRKVWSEADSDLAASTLERLITSCYGRTGDANEPRRKYIRFSLAEQLERQGDFSLSSDSREIMAWIDDYLDNPSGEVA